MIFSECPPESFREVLRVLQAKALEGDIPAARLFLEYVVGKPPQCVEVANEPEDEFRVAGCTPAELNRMMLQRLQQRIDERQEREEELAKVRLPGYGTTNGVSGTQGKPSGGDPRNARRPESGPARKGRLIAGDPGFAEQATFGTSGRVHPTRRCARR